LHTGELAFQLFVVNAGGNERFLVEALLPFGFLLEQMPVGWLVVGQFTRASHLKTLFGAALGLEPPGFAFIGHKIKLRITNYELKII
jgi:hypothetical protein